MFFCGRRVKRREFWSTGGCETVFIEFVHFMALGFFHHLYLPARCVFPTRHRRQRIFIHWLANVEGGELSSTRVVSRMRTSILQRRLALIRLVVWLWRIGRWGGSLFVVATPFIRRTASRTAPETAASALSSAAHASRDAGDK